MAAATPVASESPCDLITVPFKPRKTPPLTRLGSIPSANILSCFDARIEPIRDKKLLLKTFTNRSLINFAVPSPVLRAMLPVKPSVTITSTVADGMSLPSTKPINS